MRKLKKILLILCLTFLIPVKSAGAFFPLVPFFNLEIFQPFNSAFVLINSSVPVTTIEEARKIQQKVMSYNTGSPFTSKKIFGPYKTQLTSIDNNNFGIKTVDYLKDVAYSPLESQMVLREEQLIIYGAGDDLAKFNEAEEKNKEILYENLASLYAISLTTHAELLQEQADEEATEDLNERDLIQATTLQASTGARLLAANLLLEASKAQYRRNMQLSAIKTFAESNDDEDDSEDDTADDKPDNKSAGVEI